MPNHSRTVDSFKTPRAAHSRQISMAEIKSPLYSNFEIYKKIMKSRTRIPSKCSSLTQEDFSAFTPKKTGEGLLKLAELSSPNDCWRLDTTAGEYSDQKDLQSNRMDMTIHYNKLEFYTGEVDEEFQPDGYGTFQYENGDIYEGDFKKGKRDGEGEYIYSDGKVYIGCWKDDKKEGHGSLKLKNKEIDAKWKDNEPFDFMIYDIKEFKYNGCTENSSFITAYEGTDADQDSKVNFANEENTTSDIFDENIAKTELKNNIKRLSKETNYKIDIDLVGTSSRLNTRNLFSELLQYNMSEEWETLASDKVCLMQCENQNIKCNCKKLRSKSVTKKIRNEI